MQHTLIDPFELVHTLPPPRAPMATMSIDVDFADEQLIVAPVAAPSEPDLAPDSWTRIRCWCSED